MNKRASTLQLLFVLILALAFPVLAFGKGKTLYVHLLDGNDTQGDGSYARPFKSWQAALCHVGSGDTLIAKNGDYRTIGRAGNWGGLSLILTMADSLVEGDPQHGSQRCSSKQSRYLPLRRYKPSDHTRGDKIRSHH